MMDFIKFIFSSGWTYVGTLILLLVIGSIIIAIVKEIKKPKPEEIKHMKSEIERLKCEATAFKPWYRRVENKVMEEKNGGDIKK